eukprot:s1725_g19.t1
MSHLLVVAVLQEWEKLTCGKQQQSIQSVVPKYIAAAAVTRAETMLSIEGMPGMVQVRHRRIPLLCDPTHTVGGVVPAGTETTMEQRQRCIWCEAIGYIAEMEIGRKKSPVLSLAAALCAWQARGVLLWLLQRPYLRYLPVPYPMVFNVRQWQSQCLTMAEAKCFSRRHLARARQLQAFNMANLVEMKGFGNRIGLEFAFLEDPRLPAMMTARSSRKMSLELKQEAALAPQQPAEKAGHEAIRLPSQVNIILQQLQILFNQQDQKHQTMLKEVMQQIIAMQDEHFRQVIMVDMSMDDQLSQEQIDQINAYYWTAHYQARHESQLGEVASEDYLGLLK